MTYMKQGQLNHASPKRSTSAKNVRAVTQSTIRKLLFFFFAFMCASELEDGRIGT